jgi:hypothetical protein
MIYRISMIFLLIVLMSNPLRAQNLSLTGGTWIHLEDDPDYLHPGGIIHLTYLARFSAEGRLTIRTATASDDPDFEYVMIDGTICRVH